jgi:hypothetical protein
MNTLSITNWIEPGTNFSYFNITFVNKGTALRLKHLSLNNFGRKLIKKVSWSIVLNKVWNILEVSSLSKFSLDKNRIISLRSL